MPARHVQVVTRTSLAGVCAWALGPPAAVVAPGGPVTVDGFAITGGDYTGLGNPADAGYTVCGADGGIDCGGGIFLHGGVFVLRNSVVTGNAASRNRGQRPVHVHLVAGA